MNTPLTAGRYVGQSVKRLEDPRLLAGHGRYVDDVQIPGTLHVAFVRSTIARGNITNIDISAALALPGVHAVYTAADINPRVVMFWHTMLGPGPELGGVTAYPPTRPLADGDVRFVGDPIVLVIADSRYCFPLPAGYSDAAAAPLLCAGLIGYRALTMAGDAQRRRLRVDVVADAVADQPVGPTQQRG